MDIDEKATTTATITAIFICFYMVSMISYSGRVLALPETGYLFGQPVDDHFGNNSGSSSFENPEC